MAGVCVKTTIAVRNASRQLSEQNCEEHRADGDHREHQDAHRARPRKDRGHGEDAGSDDAPDDEAGCGAQAERVRLRLVPGRHLCRDAFRALDLT